jgi:hypothetical protein
MAKKNRKQRKSRETARKKPKSLAARRRGNTRRKEDAPASPPWIQMVSSGAEDEPKMDLPWGYLSERNGRRTP